MSGILLGYELGTGSPVTIPFHHLVATGVTGLSGKTTTLEALISRAGMRAIAFRTKRGETGFEDARVHAPYYRERSDWQYVSMLLEATMREKMRFERSWIIKVSKGTHGLREVLNNVKLAKKTAKGLNESVYTNLEAYLEIVVPQIESAGIVHDLSVGEGVTVMDLEGMTDEMQSLVIASTLERVHESERDLVVVIPEAWKYCPEGRGNPVKRVAEKLIRQGATLRLYLWFDSIPGYETVAARVNGLVTIGKIEWLFELPGRTESTAIGEELKHFDGVVEVSANHPVMGYSGDIREAASFVVNETLALRGFPRDKLRNHVGRRLFV